MAETTMLRWTLEEIIEAVCAEIEPPTVGKMRLKPVRLYAFITLALGKRKRSEPPTSRAHGFGVILAAAR